MGRSRPRTKGRRDGPSFVALPHVMLEHENFAVLSKRAKACLIDLFSQYRGNNNGDLSLAPKIMKAKGWRSQAQLHKAKNELLEKGWIIETRKGGLFNKASLYAVTWLPIHECNGKLDCKPNPVQLGYWKLGFNPENQNACPRSGQDLSDTGTGDLKAA